MNAPALSPHAAQSVAPRFKGLAFNINAATPKFARPRKKHRAFEII